MTLEEEWLLYIERKERTNRRLREAQRREWAIAARETGLSDENIKRLYGFDPR